MAHHSQNEFFPKLLQTKEHSQLLDIIDVLRSHGVSHYVPLPQIIVCGDQSSGKSSVLNAVSGVLFPAKEGLCTRFAIELILRRSSETNVKVGIIAGADRSDEERSILGQFQYSDANLENLANVIESAQVQMGVGVDGKSFSSDVLRIEISGPQQSNLTLVDLPGVIHSPNKQQSSEDVQLVSNLVKKYMASPRSIILAVVSAQNDYQNQIVTRLAYDADPKGQRTLGIITKPDTLHVGSEKEKSFVGLAKNEAVPFRLGWHVLRNRDWIDRDKTSEERDVTERDFFADGVWTGLPRKYLGVTSLTPRLSAVLHDQIVSELPNLVSDVTQGIEECKARLAKLGISRESLETQKLYLIGISQSFGSLIKAAVDGIYTDRFFGDANTKQGYSKRLRAVIQDILTQFKEDMRVNGHDLEIVDQATNKDDDPRKVSRDDFLRRVKELLRRSRGRELPGLFNPMLVADLFYNQSKPWSRIVDTYRAKILEAVATCLKCVLNHITDGRTGDGLHRHILGPATEQYSREIRIKIDEIMKQHLKGHPITYNHYFTDSIVKARRERMRRGMRERLFRSFQLSPVSDSGYVSKQSFDIGALVDTLSEVSEQDMDMHACGEATDAMQAYYKVALKVLVDNFATLAVEFCVVEKLSNLFTPEMVVMLPSEVLREIASEPEESQEERRLATAKLDSLENGLRTLRVLHRYKIQEEEEDELTTPETESAMGVKSASNSETEENYNDVSTPDQELPSPTTAVEQVNDHETRQTEPEPALPERYSDLEIAWPDDNPQQQAENWDFSPPLPPPAPKKKMKKVSGKYPFAD